MKETKKFASPKALKTTPIKLKRLDYDFDKLEVNIKFDSEKSMTAFLDVVGKGLSK